MSINKKTFQASDVNRLTRNSVATYVSWIRHIGFYAILSIALLFTGCDTAVVDNGSSLSADPELGQMMKAGDSGDVPDICEAAKLDVSLVMDVSGSMAGAPLAAAKAGAKVLVAELSDTDQGALISFTAVAQRDLELTLTDAAGQAALNAAIDGLSAGGGTNIGTGIVFGAEELLGDESLFALNTNPSGNDRVDATKIMVVLSDGRTQDETGTFNAATTAKNAGIRIFTIAIGNADLAAMASYASSPDDAFTTADLGELTAIFSEIAQSICPTPVAIDIKPGSDPNSIKLNKSGVISVAVFSSYEFDANAIDPETVRFGSIESILNGEGALLAHEGGHIEDVNFDGLPDFVGHFVTDDTGFTSDDLFGWLVGETYDGESFAGNDAVRLLNPGKPSI